MAIGFDYGHGLARIILIQSVLSGALKDEVRRLSTLLVLSIKENQYNELSFNYEINSNSTSTV